MAQYIPKDVLVAKIDKRRNKHFNSGGSPSSEYCYEDDEILNIIDTLEVKEVDLNREINLVEDKYYGFESLSRADIIDIAKHFYSLGLAQKEEQFEKNRLAACDKQTEEEAHIERDFVMGIIENEHRQPTFDDAIKYGMRLQKEQMMAEAIDVEVKMDAGGYPYINKTIELYDYDKDVPLAKTGEKVKVLVIKEG